LVLFYSGEGQAQDAQSPYVRSLQGIKSFSVIPFVTRDLLPHVSEEDLETLVTNLLDSLGIPVLPEDSSDTRSGDVWLWMEVRGQVFRHEEGPPLALFALNAHITQPVLLARDSSIQHDGAITWIGPHDLDLLPLDRLWWAIGVWAEVLSESLAEHFFRANPERR
jgi:hypothetical protein